MAKCDVLWRFVDFSVVFLCIFGNVMAQEEAVCQCAGSIAASVVLTLVVAALVAAVAYFLWNKFIKPKKGEKYQEHEAYSVGYYVKCSYDDALSYYRSYRGENCAAWFTAELKDFAENVETVFKCPLPMNVLTAEQECKFRQASSCHICEKPLGQDRVRDHDHLTGAFRGAAHNECNLEFQDSRTVPVVFHNFSGYDSHFLIRDVARGLEGRMTLIPNNTEKFISFFKSMAGTDIKFKFIDSCRFMASSLDKLSSYLEVKKIVHSQFPLYNDEKIDLLTRKGVFPYEYVQSWVNLDETDLPSRESFRSQLTDSEISSEDYAHAQKVWREFNITTLGEYSDLYLKTDVLLLADVFEAFRDVCLNNYHLDPAHYMTAPSLSWDAMLKNTGVQLDMIGDVDMLMFFERGIRGGLTQCSKRHARANNQYMSGHDSASPTNYLMYYDINAMYAWAMSQHLPAGELKWVEGDVSSFNFNLPDDTPTGYVLEVDLDYPMHIHDRHSDLPMAPAKGRAPGSKQDKMLATLEGKRNYIIHYRNLKQYVAEGLIVSKIHRVIQFKQSPWLRKYIDLNAELRRNSRNEFEKNFFKLMSNAVFGKTMENVRNRRVMKLVHKWHGRYAAESLISKPNFHSTSIIEDDLVLIELLKTEVFFDKPIYVGMAILDISKTALYEFHYSYMKNKYGKDCTLCYTDTDSLIYDIRTADIYQDIRMDISRFDTSDYSPDNPYGIPLANKKIPGLMKDENCGQHLITETDPEKGKGEYAFDNPGFKDAGLSPVGKPLEKSKVDSGSKTKWNQWSPLGVLTTKNEKKRTLDDSAIEDQVKIVTLRSHDFTGLGFNICGNMKDGIFIKDILNRGPAVESGKLSSGDRINSVTINFGHIVYEDALAILSYASPYEVTVSAKNGKAVNYPGQSGRPAHPIYRSSSSTDLTNMEKSSKKRLFQADEASEIGSNYSSLQKNRSTATTLERTKSKSPKPSLKLIKPKSKLSPDQLKIQLEQNIVEDFKETMRMKNDFEQPLRVEAEHQKSDNKHHKFGVQVLPMETREQNSPKTAELSQNDNNINLELSEPAVKIMSIDEVDKKVAPPVKRREKINKPVEPPEVPPAEAFERQNSLNDSGIKRDRNNIPLEIPNNMFNAALAARKNRKSLQEEDDIKSPKKMKGKAPAPPEAGSRTPEEESANKFDEIYPVEEGANKLLAVSATLNKSDDSIEKMKPEISNVNLGNDIKDYNSDSDIETDNQSSVNTIELNASDITVHQSEENEEKQNRKTASTGDLTKIQKTRKTSTGTLERAQSLDITDTAMPGLAKKRKAGRIEDSFDSKTSSDESLYGNALINKEPRLSLILDGLNTFQRSRLKKSTEWGNLEDAILNLDKQDDSVESLDKHNSSYEDIKLSAENISKNFNFGTKSPEFDALVNKINEIKQETIEIINEQDRNISKPIDPDISKEEMKEIIEDVPTTMQTMSKTIEEMPKSIEAVTLEEIYTVTTYTENQSIPNENVTQIKDIHNQIWPVRQLDIKVDNVEKPVYKRSETFEIKFNEPSTIEIKDNYMEVKTNKPDDAIVSTDKVLITQIESKPLVKPEIIDIKVNKNALKEDPIPVHASKVETFHKPTITHKVIKADIPVNLSQVNNFIMAEREASSKFVLQTPIKLEDTNVSDDIKVSRHSLGSLESNKYEIKSESQPESMENVSNIMVSDKDVEPLKAPMYEVSINKNEVSTHYIKDIDTKPKAVGEEVKTIKSFDNVIVSTPDLIKNITIAEAIHDLNNEVTVDGPTSLTFEIPASNIEVTETKVSSTKIDPTVIKYDDNKLEFKSHNGIQMKTNGDINKMEVPAEAEKNNSSLTYITEIQVLTPNNKNRNISEIEIIPKVDSVIIEQSVNKNLDNDFDNYIKNFESNIKNFENNINSFEQNIQDVAQTAKMETSQNTKSIIVNDKVDAEKELLKVQEIVEEQLKKLPEMRFTTSSYESQIKPPEKRQSQIEILRSNFEKSVSPPRLARTEPSPPKSRIPVLNKTPPTSPERRDSKNLDTEPDKEILEIMSSHIPMTSSLKYQPKTTSRNVTVTSIRSNSKIPSGLPTYSSRPPVPPRKTEHSDDNLVQVSTNGNSDSSFRQWVFNPSDSAVTNITVTETKYERK